ncbi:MULTISPECIES: hypothetical protein [Aerococcus]|uniref:Lipoprotein n=1 Tax=Aerococcus tenax TaxID=3078812 RepID=A0A5N1BJQ0_9LACT|nr:hypothetical protein [Aerococcus urinae]KAA9240387.1 hypothetical protein F6I34_04865 [Aerococcus urinae]MDK7302747.1 hypothetical protein [Aerococcus urinae]MDK7801469.1 hypothetical protein [Aerococcus urinae]MDK8654991.1 hypothetical protein [Aerococcus urinae]RAV70787.1 hypothetical protein DBT40_06190 [Aerococcus urinae]
MQWKKYLSLVLVAATLLGCSCAPSNETAKQPSEPEPQSNQFSEVSDSSVSKTENTSQTESKKESHSTPNQTEAQTAANEDQADESQVAAPNNPLAAYDPLAIEYARIWLQLGPNQNAEAINVHIIPQGTLINPYLANGATYPETVTQLAGNRLVDGVVTYSSNHDGTINLYNIPLRFDLPDFSAIPESTYINETYKMAQSTQRLAVDPNQPDQVIQTIQKLHR